MKKLKELLDYIQPTKYIVSSGQYSDEYSIPVLTAGDTFLLGFTNDNDGIYPASKNNPIILFDDFTTAIKWVDFPFKVKSSACKILVPINGANLKYCYYAMRALNFDHTMHKRYWISEYSEQSINDYRQKNQLIVNELDTINSLIDLKKKRVTDFDEIIKSRFIELFMNDNKDRYPLSKWEDVVTIKHGKDYKKNIAKHGGYPVYGSGGFMGVYADKYLVNENATVIGRKGTIDKPIFVNEKFWNVDTAFGIEVNEKILNPVFFFVRSTLYDLKAFSTSTTLPSMTKDALHKITIGIPPLELQNNFANIVIQIDKSKFIVT